MPRSKKPKNPRDNRPPRTRNDAGLRAKNFPRPLRWAVDQDYTDQLAPEEKEWLARFNDAFYGGDFRRDEQGEWSQEQRRAAWTAQRSIKADAYSISEGGGALDYLDEDPRTGETSNTDEAPTPDYLNTEDYKRARSEFRGQLSQGRRDVEPAPTLRMAAARARLRQVVKAATAKEPQEPARSVEAPGKGTHGKE